MNKHMLLLPFLLLCLTVSGCRVSINRLNKRIDRWESIRKDGFTRSNVRFARETLFYFLNTVDFQRSGEALVTESERLQYHRKLGDIQVFLLDYHATQALEHLDSGDLEAADLEWARADSLSQGFLPAYKTPVYKMVLLQRGYDEYLRQISWEGERYNRLERDFPGLMAAFRKMSEFQFRKAEKYYAEGEWRQALEHYLLVFKRDREHYPRAENAVKRLAGKNMRQIYDRRFRLMEITQGYISMRMELYSTAENQIMAAQNELGEERWEEMLPDIWAEIGKRFSCAPEQAADVYYLLKHEMEGTLPVYIGLWRHDVLKGRPPAMTHLSELWG